MNETLRRSADRKVTFNPTPNMNIRVNNSFGLPAGPAYSCPTATSICEKICYAQAIEKRFKNTNAMLHENFRILKACDTVADMEALIFLMIKEFESECERKNVEKAFRIHWDGDFYSMEYAQAWANVIRDFPEVTFWVYTRAFTPVLNVVKTFENLDNLAFYLSVDADNEKFAADIIATHPWVKVSILSDTMDNAGKEMKELTGKPGAKCPELIGSIPLISAEGGACAVCRLCVDGKADIRFAHKKAGRK